MVRVGLVRCRLGGRRLRLTPARPGRCHGPAMPGGAVMVADQPLDPVGEGEAAL
jgi:hypothetical protein